MNDIQLVIFDLAGTTIKDAGQVSAAFVSALAEHNIAITPERLAAVRGASKRKAVLEFIPEGPTRERLAEAAYASFRQQLTRLYRTNGVESIDGAEPLFHWLKERGVRVALNTGFERDITTLLLAELGWNKGIVDAVVCGDEVKSGRPSPDLILHAMKAVAIANPRNVANVGDTVLDLRAGANAGVGWNVGVLSGAHGRALLEQAPHTHLFESIAELRRLWD